MTAAVQAGVTSGLKQKRILLGRVVQRAVLDDAKVDEATLIITVLGQIDAPHVRSLEAICRAEEEADAAGEIEPRAEGAEREVNARIRDAGAAQPPPIVSALIGLGLLESTASFGGNVIALGPTPFGRSLISDLREAR